MRQGLESLGRSVPDPAGQMLYVVFIGAVGIQSEETVAECLETSMDSVQLLGPGKCFDKTNAESPSASTGRS